MPHKTSLALLLASVLIAPSACSKKDEGDNKPSSGTKATGGDAPTRTLTVYSGRTEKLVGPALDAFEKASGIKLKVKYAGTPELAAALLDEGKSSPADVFIAQDASTLGFLDGKSIFATLPEAIAARVPAGFRAETGNWVGLTGRARVLAYNTSKLRAADLPASASALTEEAWKGRVGWAPENASFQSSIAAMIQLEGAEATKAWLEAMKANKPRDYPKNTPAVMAVSRGEVDVALVNHYYLYRLRAEHGDKFPVENHYFKDGSAHAMVNLSGAAILATSKKQDAAAELVTYLLSDEGQRFFVEANHEFPTASGVKSPSGLPSIDTINAPVLDLAKLRDLKAANDLLRDAGVLP